MGSPSPLLAPTALVYIPPSLEIDNLLFSFLGFWLFSWLNTTMTENRKTLNASDLDGFDKVFNDAILLIYLIQ